MASQSAPIPLAPNIRAVLAGLRWRIRAYVWLEGLFLALVWVGLTFWAALALDYLPVLVGASEMPWQARAVILAGISLVLAYILYRWILRRAFVRLADHSMAVLLERRFQKFQDSLVTAVEMSERPDHAVDFSKDMLLHSKEDALAQIGHVRLGEVFNFAPLMLSGLFAALLGGTIGLFAVFNLEALTLWSNRLYMLDTEPWPRSARVEVVGIEVLRAAAAPGESPTSQVLDFKGQAVKVAKGSNVKLRVHADAAARVVPEVCVLKYHTAESDRGRVNMQRVGRARQGYQDYTYDGKPLKGILSTIDFDVLGYDHRTASYRIDVVESPAVVETQLYCEFPPYMVNEKLSLRLPRTLDLTTGMQLPRGTSINIRGRANKDLAEVRIRNVDSGETTSIDVGREGDRQSFSLPVIKLDQNLSLEVILLDTDGVLSERPHRVVVAAVPDEAPRVEILLEGIGSAITPDARIPVSGKVQDDYDVAKTWFELAAGDLDPHEFPIELAAAGKLSAAVDLREIRSEGEKALSLKPKDKLVLTVKASDKYNLEGAANIGSGDRYELDVVTPEELLALLETREAGMRRRFEQIIEEMTESRDSLLRVKSETPEKGAKGPAATAVPGEKPLDPKEAEERAKSLRLLFVQRALLQSSKSAQEVLGVSGAFREIREEIINNRIDSEDRKARLKDEVADPLEHVAKELFPELDKRLVDLEKQLAGAATADAAAQASIDQANEILLELDKVLQKLIKFETYNELIDIVRSLIAEQERLIDATKTQQKNEAKRDLLK